MVEAIRVSVAMITYNGEPFLAEQLDTILYQLEECDELVISDDGSSDGTRQLIEAYCQKDSRIRLLQGPCKGIKKNVEHVLSACRGEIIFLTDQDDVWKPRKLELVLKTFEKEQADLVIHDAEVFAEDMEHPEMDSFFAFRSSRPGVMKNIVKNSYIGCCMAFRRKLLEQVLPIPDQIEMHDQWIGILNDFYYKKSYFLQKPLISYRRHGENNSAMTHYGMGRMIRNRVVFVWYLVARVLHLA